MLVEIDQWKQFIIQRRSQIATASLLLIVVLSFLGLALSSKRSDDVEYLLVEEYQRAPKVSSSNEPQIVCEARNSDENSSEISSLREEIADLKRTHSQLLAQLRMTETQLEAEQRNADQLRLDLGRLEREAEELRQREAHAGEKTQQSQQDTAQAPFEDDLLYEQCIALKELVEEKQRRIGELESEYSGNENLTAQREEENLRLRKQCEQLKNQLDQTQRQLAKSESIVKGFSDYIHSSRQSLTALKDDCSQLNAQREKKRPHPAVRAHTVQKGDTLFSLSKKYYGKTDRWQEIQTANGQKITDVNRLAVGDLLIIPMP